MRVKTEHGFTDVYFKDFVAVNDLVEQVRDGYRKACLDRPEKNSEHAEKVVLWCSKNFGDNRYLRDYDAVVGDKKASEALSIWEAWINAQPMIHRKLYYTPEVVAACIMGEDE